jgi:hypothetical protein
VGANVKITFEKLSGRPAYLGAQVNRPSAHRADTLRDLYIPQLVPLTPPPSDRSESPIKFGKILENLFLVIATGLGIFAAGFLILFVEIH